ncbi:MAG: hypothetical protein CMD28_02695 [Flavobacteriales bacterium]|nr:hypothetical protein [Flavobacteriales bacterium]
MPDIDECYDPKSKEHVRLGSFPSEHDCVLAINSLVSVLKKYNVNVYFPQNIIGLNQIFSRDIAFAIEDKLVLPNIIDARRNEVDAIEEILSQIEEKDVIKMYFGIDREYALTLNEIGEEFGLTRERVRQIKEKAVRRLKQTSRSKILKTYLG